MRRWELYQSWNCIRVRTSSMLQSQSLKTTTMTMTSFFVGEREEFVCLFLLIRLDIVHERLVWELQSQLKLPTARWLERDECPLGPSACPQRGRVPQGKTKEKIVFLIDRLLWLKHKKKTKTESEQNQQKQKEEGQWIRTISRKWWEKVGRLRVR